MRLLSEQMARGESAEQARSMDGEIQRMDMLTRLLLDAAQFERGRLKLVERNFNISKLIETVVEAMKNRAQVIIDSPAMHLVRGDPDRITQVLSNLIDNACKYSESGKPVTVRTRLKTTGVEVAVIDQGRGIPKKEQAKLFDPFFRTHAAKRSGIRGSGLGLYIVREILRAHKSGIQVYSRIGKGTTFQFILPLEKSKHVSQ
jgi:signal transduction histidine kinase